MSIPDWSYLNEGKPTIITNEKQIYTGSPSATAQEVPTTPVAPHSRSFRSRFDALFPLSKRYFGLRRKWALICALGVFLAVLVFIIGLAAGLSSKHKSNSAKNLPLPTNSQTFDGDLTYYDPGLGACGIVSTEQQNIVAISHFLFDKAATGSNPNANPLCGRKIRATRYDESVGSQRSVDLTVVDRCVGCQATDLDVSPSAFAQLADPGLGRVTTNWAWL